MAYAHPHTVRFREVDAAGILYFSRVFELCHDAFEGALAAAGRPLSGFFDAPEWILPIVHVEADYRRPMRLGDALVVEVRLAEVGARSISFGFAVSGPAGDLRATARHVHVCVDARSFSSRELPAELLEALRAVMPDQKPS